MELVVRFKRSGVSYKCLPGFINIMNDKRFLVREGYVEKMREMYAYDVYLKPLDTWMDLLYAYNEGFLEPSQLRKW
jgi:hypothetical protein